MAQIARANQHMPHVIGTLPHWIEGVYLITRVENDAASDGVSQSIIQLATVPAGRQQSLFSLSVSPPPASCPCCACQLCPCSFAR